jgi:hypothetical protein
MEGERDDFFHRTPSARLPRTAKVHNKATVGRKMTNILPPDASVTFIAALLVPLLLGFLVGIVAKAAVKIGVAIAIIIIILIAVGFLTPNDVIQPLVQLVESGPRIAPKVQQIAGYLPYSSITFILGLIIGFFKG